MMALVNGGVSIRAILCLMVLPLLLICGGCSRSPQETVEESGAEEVRVDDAELEAMLLASFEEEIQPETDGNNSQEVKAADSGTREKDDLESEGMAKVISRVKELRAAGRFDDARLLARRGLQQLGGQPDATELRRLERQVTKDLQDSTRLQFAFRQLGASSRDEREAAARELLRGGDVGLILLRRAISLGTPRMAVSAALKLVEAADPAGCNNVIERILNSDDPRLISALLRIMAKTGRSFDLQYVPSLYAFMSSDSGKPHEELIWEILRVRATGELPAEELKKMLTEIKADHNFQQRGMVQFLASVYIRKCRREPAAFDRLFKDKGAHSYLAGYVSNARDSGLKVPAAWGRAMENAFKQFDFSKLEENLLIWYPLDDISGRRVENKMGSKHHGELRDISLKPIPGVSGNCLDFSADNARIEIDPRDKMEKIHHRDYSFAAWVKPAGRPSGEQPDINWGVVIKEGWHIGLLINQEGLPMMTHYLHGNEAVTALSDRPLPLDRWSLLVGSVDRSNGTVRLFVNGVREAETRFAQMSMASGAQDRRPLRIGLAKPGTGDWSCRFKGAIDEVRIYERALDATDAAALYALSE